MAVTVTEMITATLVFNTTQRRNQAESAVTKYLSRPRAGSREHAIFPVDPPKYPGPALIINCAFNTRADADEAWSDLMNIQANWLVVPSLAEQFTSTEDPQGGINENQYHHRAHWPAQPDDF